MKYKEFLDDYTLVYVWDKEPGTYEQFDGNVRFTDEPERGYELVECDYEILDD